MLKTRPFTNSLEDINLTDPAMNRIQASNEDTYIILKLWQQPQEQTVLLYRFRDNNILANWYSHITLYI